MELNDVTQMYKDGGAVVSSAVFSHTSSCFCGCSLFLSKSRGLPVRWQLLTGVNVHDSVYLVVSVGVDYGPVQGFSPEASLGKAPAFHDTEEE